MRRIDEHFAVSGQVTAADIAAIKAQGFRSIICNRPDGEGRGQPTFAEIERAARAAGLDAAHVPVRPGAAGPEDVARMAELIRSLPGPVLAYCASGMRSAALYQKAQAGTRSGGNSGGSGSAQAPAIAVLLLVALLLAGAAFALLRMPFAP